MSDVQGIGFGSDHNWKNLGTDYTRTTHYQCKKCGMKFGHRRARESEAMARSPRIAELREALSHCGAQRGKAVRGSSIA